MSQTATISLETLTREPQQRSGVTTPRDEPGDAFESGQAPHHEFSLPPVDTGKDAWLFLAACFVIEALVWGFPFSFGIFQKYYSSHEPFMGSGNIAIIGTCTSGIMYLSGLPALVLNRMYPRVGRWLPVAGLLVMCLSLALSSLATTVTQLIATQGVLYAVGGSIGYLPCILYMDEWFVKRKGLAYGIMWSGTGLAGVILPLLLEYLLNTYGYETTLRVWACSLFVLTAPLAYFIKPRLPPSPVTHLRSFNLRFALSTPFVLYQLANVVEAVGFFLPGIYLPSYAADALKAGPFPSALTALLVNVSSVAGCVGLGFLIDRLHVTTCILACTVGATVGTFLLWGFAVNLPVLYIFCIMYGLSAGSFTTTWTGIMREVSMRYNASTTAADGDSAGHSRSIDPSLVFVLLAAGRGIGNVASGPLSEVLIKGQPWQGEAGAGYGSGYGALIVFTGVSALLGGGSFLGRIAGRL
ncbi:hypothetical protein Daus18300_004497 [Diaporthe australafricana]|uniref:Major facilitator superfamily (MFS) profile domain-containing protein n=1 Tax=Diaporthe australafricana TaxID=127596 RepID=A0ABR3X8Y7_9PEZI